MEDGSDLNYLVYNESALKDLYLSSRSLDNTLYIKSAVYEPSEQQTFFELRQLPNILMLEYLLTKARVLSDLIVKGEWKSASFYQGDELKTFVHGPQKVYGYVGHTDYRAFSLACPVAVVVIGGSITLVPSPI